MKEKQPVKSHLVHIHTFPGGEEIQVSQTSESLRDWFAGQATEKDIEMFMGDEKRECWGPASMSKEEKVAFERANRVQAKYQYADAMLKAREAKPLPTKPEGGKL